MDDDSLAPDISPLRERDSEIHETVEDLMPLALEFLEKGPIPKTSGVFLSFIASTEFIKNGIFDLAETGNVYSAKILTRSLIEHFLRFQYIWFRVCEDKTDAAAQDYLKNSLLKEALQIGGSWMQVAKALGRDSGPTIHEGFRSVVTGAVNYSNRKIDERASQYEYARIIEYILKKMASPKGE